MRGLDFAGGRPGAAAIKAAGYDFVVRYLDPGGPALPGKQLLHDELADYIRQNIYVAFMKETTADRMRGGRSAGVQDAKDAYAYLMSLGVPAGQVVYYPCDFDSTEADQTQINEYLRGAASYAGTTALVGIYGGFWAVSRALDAGVAMWADQTSAWSGTHLDPRRHITQSGAQVYVNGVQCDVLTAETEDFGQYPPPISSRMLNMEWTDPLIDHYQDNVPNGPHTIPAGDLVSWGATHSAHALEEVRKLREDLPEIIAAAIKDSTIHVSVTTAPTV
jgi:Domain of unknown function (DUF1906)